MEQLTVKELACYLPYDLKGKSIQEEYPALLSGMGIDEDGPYLIVGMDQLGLDDFKPYLWDLSMLTKPIVHNGEEFQPWLQLMKERDFHHEISGEDLVGWITHKNWYADMTFDDAQFIFNKLFEWHIDVFGLIPRGLALPKVLEIK